MLEEEKTKVGRSCPLGVIVQANDLSFQREAMVLENEELKKRMSGVEEMVANLIVDQQAMAKAFQERGDRHSGSLERHRANLNTAWREIIRLQTNQSTIVDECSLLRTQVESMGNNLCRSRLRKKLLDSFLLIPSLDVGNVVANAIGRTVWSTPTMGPRDPITLPS